ncbi:MAG: histone deacetylase [Bryobacteraceae bacterium]|nr:histone deacetylase [Solibacteraceae bacterium]MCO5352900.1 histone deacetylase [Bryobacteraceae bacterium]
MAVSPDTTGLVFDHTFRRHDPGPGHPESQERYLALSEALKKAGFLDSFPRLAPRLALDEDIHLVHTRPYLDTVAHDAARHAGTLSTGDTNICPETPEIARLAAGAALSAVDAVFQGHVRNAFAAVRPPGHHATASRGMGFCVYNNAAIAARYARKAWGVDRVLIADWDVHHGNGTQDIFYEDPHVFFFSIHQAPWYPGTGDSSETGAAAGKSTTLNCPFPAGTGRGPILDAFRKKLVPAMDAFRPDFVILSAGFDSRRGDPLGRFTLSDGDFIELTEITLEIAQKHANNRLISLLEGGYSPSGLASATIAHLEALSGRVARRPPPRSSAF